MIYASYRKIHPCYRKAPIYMLSRSKAPKTQQIVVTNMREKTVDLAGLDFRPRNNFANLGSFAKVSVPVQSYNFLS